MKTTFLTAVLLALGSAQAACVERTVSEQAAATNANTNTNTNTTTSQQKTYYNGTCTAENVRIRKEWRNMSDDEKSAYLEAEKCLFNLPAQTTLDGVTSRWSDSQALHRTLQNTTLDGSYVGDVIHNVGQFLPWHRYYMHMHETLLRNECNYTGPMSWWDEEADANAGDLFRSNMWASDAFGGNSSAVSGCLEDGAFANTTMHIGPALTDSDYCLYRGWTSDYIQWMTTEHIETCTQYNDYYRYFNCMVDYNTSPHVAGHNSSGGISKFNEADLEKSIKMSDIYASSGDPTFFMHHNYVDRMWWKWQTTNASSRMFDISGNTFNNTLLEVNGVTLPASVNLNTTLDYTLTSEDIIPDVTIEQVMNAQGGYLCYEYDY